jgi:tetratricopeptide (TPR) repeat protein
VAVVHSNVGLVRRQQGNLAGALAAFDEAERILSKADGGAAHPNIAVAWFGRGSVHEALGHPDRAREDIQRAIDLWLGQFGEVHPHVAGAHAELSGTYLAEGELDRAEEAAGRSVELFERALGGDHPLVAVGLASLGAVALERGDFTGAVASYTRALRLRTDTPVSREELAAARFGLARARAGANPADPEAEALARQALEGLGDAPGFDARGMSAEIRQWLAKRERLAR